MASLIGPPHLDIRSAKPGSSTIQVTHQVAFDDKDRAVNQPYDDQIRMIQVDKGVGDPVSEGADDQFGFLHSTIRPDMAPFPGLPLVRVHEWTNSAWTVIACLTHHLLRWTSLIGLPGRTIRAARTLRRRLLAIPGRLTRNARRWTLHMPARWPWQHDFVDALVRIRALPAAA
jgi:hypothetical protein